MAWHDGPKARSNLAVQAYIDDLDEPQKSMCQSVRERVMQDPEMLEGIAWGIPCYFRKGPFCYTSAAKTHITLGWFRGMEIGDESGMLKGTGKSPVAKAIWKLKAPLPEAFEMWFAQAIRLDDIGD